MLDYAILQCYSDVIYPPTNHPCTLSLSAVLDDDPHPCSGPNSLPTRRHRGRFGTATGCLTGVYNSPKVPSNSCFSNEQFRPHLPEMLGSQNRNQILGLAYQNTVRPATR